MKVCIMCGGEGTRLRPLTFERPKPCIPIVNRPSIQHLVAHLSNMGFHEIVITLGYLGSVIQEALGDGSLFGVEITYVQEETKMGTAGSVKNAQAHLDGSPFLVVGGDHVTDLNVLEFFREHQRNDGMVTIGLISIDDPSEYGIAELDANYDILRFKEKPAPGEIFSNLASTGMYVCDPAIFDHIPANTKYDFAKDLFRRGHRAQEHLHLHDLPGRESQGQERLHQARHRSGNGRGGPKHAAKRNGSSAGAAAMDRMSVAVLAESPVATLSRSEQFASFQTDAPTCDNCGAITVRNGNCYLCHNCGSSMGCS